MKRILLTAALLLMVGCNNDEAANDARDLVDDTERGVEDMIDDTERGVDDTLTDDNKGDGNGPLTDAPHNGDINGNGNPDVNNGVNDNGKINGNNDVNKNDNKIDNNKQGMGGDAGYGGPNDNESVEERRTTDKDLQ